MKTPRKGFRQMVDEAKSRIKTISLEEAKPKITDTLKAERLRDLVSKKGAEIASKIREGLKSGTPLEKVAQQSGFKLDRIPAFSLMEIPGSKPETPKDATPKDAVLKEATGMVSSSRAPFAPSVSIAGALAGGIVLMSGKAWGTGDANNNLIARNQAHRNRPADIIWAGTGTVSISSTATIALNACARSSSFSRILLRARRNTGKRGVNLT